MASSFKIARKADILGATRLRRFETKIGERVQCCQSSDLQDAIKTTSAKYVIIGIPEDIGVLGNMGVGGTQTAWPSFLTAFLNVQSNDYLDGQELFIAGHFDFNKTRNLINANAANDEEKTEAFRHAVNAIDEEVEELIKIIVSENKIPIVIGGGHNNAYPLITGSAKSYAKQAGGSQGKINCINLDAHTDFRPVEGRHSGNAFRYAFEEGYLEKYCVLGIHENYLPQNVLNDIVKNDYIDLITFEEIFLQEKMNFHQAMAHAAGFCGESLCGLELDLDSIEGVLASAATPSGLNTLHARQFVDFFAQRLQVAYLHICEGIGENEDGQTYPSIGKLIAYLVSDFIKAHKKGSQSSAKKWV